MASTAIEWSDVVYNPITGCDRISPGCDHCYALTMARRLKAMGNPRYQRDGEPPRSGPGFGLTVHHDKINDPLRWRKPRRIFVNSMSDLFHPDVPDDVLDRIFDVMLAADWHVLQVLTKRPRRMQHYVSRRFTSPLPPHIWLGVSVENQDWAFSRLPLLMDTPASVRWVSAEPLLGPVDLSSWCDGLDWVVCGGESGVGARPMELNWARSLRDQCVASGTAYFLKQIGGVRDKRGGDKAVLDGRTWREFPA